MKCNFIKILLILSIHLAAFSLTAQVVWPGDVNNNGVVNNVDWLYLSHAIEEVGPPRPIPEMGINWEGKAVTSIWGTNFPGTIIDYVYADCDGDGIVSFEDFQAIDFNFGLEHGDVTDDFAIAGEEGVDPQLFLGNEPIFSFPQGGVLFLEVHLGTEDLPVQDFSGIAFDLEYDQDVISEIYFIPSSDISSGWGQYELLDFQSNFLFDQGKISYAFSSLNNDLIENAHGALGQLFIVIEDDVVDYQDQEIETTVMLENVILFGEDFEVGAIVNDSVDITIVADPLSSDDFLNSDAVNIFPNPTHDFIYLESSFEINQIEIYNSIGGKIELLNGINSSSQKVDLSNYAPGIYFFKFSTDEGILTKKVVVL